MRWETVDVAGITFINDAYNANPLSMRANLDAFAALPGKGRKWAVIGGMRELGETAAAEHAALGRYIDTLGLDGVITVGALGGTIACRGAAHCFHVAASADAAPILKDHLQAGDAVLLKASRAERLEQVLECFRGM
jgi:UDP-N-acetylmuramoyl-tripeptide--D-alanyl-D-alanine ligase